MSRVLNSLVAVLCATNCAPEVRGQTQSTNEFRGKGICRFAVQDFPITPQMEATLNAGVSRLISLHKSVFGLTNLPPITVNIRIFATYEGFKLYPGGLKKMEEEWRAWLIRA